MSNIKFEVEIKKLIMEANRTKMFFITAVQNNFYIKIKIKINILITN